MIVLTSALTAESISFLSIGVGYNQIVVSDSGDAFAENLNYLLFNWSGYIEIEGDISFCLDFGFGIPAIYSSYLNDENWGVKMTHWDGPINLVLDAAIGLTYKVNDSFYVSSGGHSNITALTSDSHRIYGERDNGVFAAGFFLGAMYMFFEEQSNRFWLDSRLAFDFTEVIHRTPNDLSYWDFQRVLNWRLLLGIDW